MIWVLWFQDLGVTVYRQIQILASLALLWDSDLRVCSDSVFVRVRVPPGLREAWSLGMNV